MADSDREASMEDILASIKRVIAEDGGAGDGGKRSGPPAAEDEDVLELDQPMPDEEPLVSTGAAAASREKLARLSQLGPAPQTQPAPAVGDGALEAVVRDMLRPLLKDWLDRRLPEIVEELVAREVARITGSKR